MNTIEFQGKIEVDEEAQYLIASILIDNQPVKDLQQHRVDMFLVQESIDTSVALGCDIFACSCGIAECAGIWKRMLVITDGTTIKWFVRWPTYRQYTFDKEQYVNAFNTFRDQVIEMSGDLDKANKLWVFAGVETEGLFDDTKEYEPLPPEYRVELHEAVEYNDMEAVKAIVNNGYLDIDHLNHRGETPLMYAPSPDMVKLLLSLGADIAIKSSNDQNVIDVISGNIRGCYEGNELKYTDEEADILIEEINRLLT
jgi:hypothetical protein